MTEKDFVDTTLREEDVIDGENIWVYIARDHVANVNNIYLLYSGHLENKIYYQPFHYLLFPLYELDICMYMFEINHFSFFDHRSGWHFSVNPKSSESYFIFYEFAFKFSIDPSMM